MMAFSKHQKPEQLRLAPAKEMSCLWLLQAHVEVRARARAGRVPDPSISVLQLWSPLTSLASTEHRNVLLTGPNSQSLAKSQGKESVVKHLSLGGLFKTCMGLFLAHEDSWRLHLWQDTPFIIHPYGWQLWKQLCLPNLYDVLNPNTSECDCFGNRVFER